MMWEYRHVFSVRKTGVLPFWEETDCSIRAPNIATEKDMTAALRLPGIIFGDGRWKMPVKVTWAGYEDAGRTRRDSAHSGSCHAEREVSLGRPAGSSGSTASYLCSSVLSARCSSQGNTFFNHPFDLKSREILEQGSGYSTHRPVLKWSRNQLLWKQYTRWMIFFSQVLPWLFNNNKKHQVNSWLRLFR